MQCGSYTSIISDLHDGPDDSMYRYPGSFCEPDILLPVIMTLLKVVVEEIEINFPLINGSVENRVLIGILHGDTALRLSYSRYPGLERKSSAIPGRRKCRGRNFISCLERARAYIQPVACDAFVI